MSARVPAIRGKTTVCCRWPRLRFFEHSSFEKALGSGQQFPSCGPLADQVAQPPPASLLSGPIDRAWLDLSREPGGNPIGLRDRWRAAAANIRQDHKNFYSRSTLRDMTYGLAAGSVLANTSLDEDFQNWYQDDVRSSGTNDFASITNTFGEGRIFLPAFAGLAAVSLLAGDLPCVSPVGDFGCRTTRGYLVGAPPMLLAQFTLGASRPGETAAGSHWKPFDDANAVSGHAFIGAVPFITAAHMVENKMLKGGLYFCSTFTAWARINKDQHYLSQACLGWWMAYLACRAVDGTERPESACQLVPIASAEMVGVGAIFQR